MALTAPRGRCVRGAGLNRPGWYTYGVAVIVTLGDLDEDVVVELSGPINPASDTDARIRRRRGGSAANVAAAAARLGSASRFVGQVGDDASGGLLTAELAADGVDVQFVRRSGRTATIVVLVDEAGERTMLVDRGSARSLTDADPRWLDGAAGLHLTLYSLLDEPIATTSRATVALAHDRGVAVSIDVSSVALIRELGATTVRELVVSLRPALVFANADEATALSLSGPLGGAAVIVKRGPDPCTLHRPHADPIDIPAVPFDRTVDTTGAGDAFAAGVLSHHGWRDDVITACASGHRAANGLLRSR
jgi:sugar/nucleoside kinase (ribokinase family)